MNTAHLYESCGYLEPKLPSFYPDHEKGGRGGGKKAHDPKQISKGEAERQLTDPVAASQASLKPCAMDLGRYVSVVPLTTSMSCPLWNTEASDAMLTPLRVMSTTCTMPSSFPRAQGGHFTPNTTVRLR